MCKGKNRMQNFFMKIEKQICSYQYVSFDIFDTLIKRSVSSPERIFDFVEYRYNEKHPDRIKGFRTKRIQAERCARKQKTKEDVTLDEIYKYLDYSGQICNALKKEEIALEIETCCVNGPVLEIYHKCLKDGKNIIVTTDMYLDRHVISSILEKAGVREYTLFLSSEVGYTKQSGNIYDYILKTLQISPAELIHIGDNRKSDYENALKKGIGAIWLWKEKDVLHYWKKKASDDGLGIDHLYSVIKNKNIPPKEAERYLGYKFIGPIIVDFCLWLHHEKELHHFDKIAFIAREGYLLLLAYKILFPQEEETVTYLRVNKNTLRLPMIYIDNSVKTFVSLLPEKKVYRISEIIRFLYIDEQSAFTAKLLKKYDYSHDTIINRVDMISDNKFHAFYMECLKVQSPKMKEQYEYLLQYLTQNGIDRKVALVNNSIHANAQFSLQKISDRNGRNTEFWGIHFIISQKGIKRINHKCSVWFHEKCSQFEKILFYRNCLIFEHILFESCGSALYYLLQKNEIGVLCERHIYEKENDKILEKIREGVMEFANEYIKKMPVYTDSSYHLNALCQFFLKPERKDVSLIGNMKDYDGKQDILISNWNQGKMVLHHKSPNVYNMMLYMELFMKMFIRERFLV